MSLTLGSKIKDIRLNLGLSREEFGSLINGANISLVSKWENNKSVPGIERLHLIAKQGNITFEDLIKHEDSNYFSEKIEKIKQEIDKSYTNLKRIEMDLNEAEIKTRNAKLNSTTALEIFDFIDTQYAPSHLTKKMNIELEKLNLLKNELKELARLSEKLKSYEDYIEVEEVLNNPHKNLNEISIERILSLDSKITLNNKTLSKEEKEKALQILKLVFK
ncbi:helix-turn-helix domain-containing protein [Lysinibacillus sp. SGAir0095]|uniref:helix-turn-helix domain-containing protein n=1 Tax=Lysinibacillus sp. SGAir0095 TaxID=2070463 RepID=UPI0010CCBF26|nr:helix-turn-helix transcriptional regulator [Lysinibacillus sp. SGAir0095]QCR33587.1 hypothetical protein C1N55_16125 [Lysinibacillus sp. SGAir0095]